ncbi:glyoxalase, partial [Paraburkholderia hospita]
MPGASDVERSPLPGGGYVVRLTDPSGFRVDAIWGQAPAATLSHRPPLPFNSVDAAVRINGTQRPPEHAPEIIRLGHIVLELADYQDTCAWYAQHFG